MKKSFMTRVLAVSLSAAMTFSLSAANMATASAASKTVVLSPSTVTLQYGSKPQKTLKLKNNTLKWKIKKATVAEKGSTAKGKKVLTVTNTTSKVVLKVKNIKKSHKVTVTVKLRRTKNKKTYSKTLKCKVTANPQASTVDPGTDDPVTPAVFSVTANATSKTNVDLTFTQPVDRDKLVPANFKVDAEGVEVTNVEGGDGRNVRLTLSGAESNKEYTLNITGLTVDGNAVDDQSIKFTTPVETADGYTLKLTSNSDQIKADGYAEALISCEVRDPQGNPVKDKDYTVRFSSDRGSFSRPDSVTVDGVATNVLRSEALDVARDVKITAEIIRVEGTDDANLVGTQATMSINMTPILQNVVVNPVEGAESNQADRLTLHFQNKVDDDTYKVNGAIDKSRIKVEVFNNIPRLGSISGDPQYSTEDGSVVNLVPVAGDDKALQVLVDTPLSDNRYVGVRVKMTDPESGKTSTYEESFMLTDSTTPRVLKVEPVNRRQLKVTYSEAVLPEKFRNGVLTQNDMHAENLSNYLIGGQDLNASKWGEGDKKAKVEVGSGLDNQDGREVVTITLGDDKYFDPDKYTLTVHNIGDWAAFSDGRNNIVTTDSKDFTISADDTKPDIEKVEVQSPEQILVTFNKPVKKHKDYSVDNKTLALPVKRQAQDGTSANDDDETNVESIIQLRDNGTDVSGKDGINPIRVTQVDSVGREFLIETTKDWSDVYGQRGSYNDDYFNHKYQIHIPANSLVNTDNGEKNASDITRDLSDDAVLKAADTTAPVIDSNITWNGSEAFVKFNEPVKIRNIGQTRGLNDEGTTVSVKQKTAANDNNIQQATAEFICPGKDTVAGTFDRFTNSTDTEVVVKPANGEELSAGNWTLRISGVSDDFGNTTAGGGNVEVKGTETGFKVAWASVASDDAFNPSSNWNAATSATGNWVDPNGNIYIFVKFTNAVNTKSSAVYDMRNYTINSNNGAEIRDAYIKAGIKGYDDNSGITDSITIVIPQRSAYVVSERPQNTTIAISSQVASLAGQALTNQEYRLPYNSNVVKNYDADTNAIYGDYGNKNSSSDGEKFGDKGQTSASAYKAAVEAAIKSDNYRKIVLDADITDLNITRPVDIDLNGHNLMGTTRANFNDGATCNIYNNLSGAVTVKKLDINTPNADWKIQNVKVVKELSSGNIIDDTTGGTVYVEDVVIRAIPANTLTNEATIETITVNSVNKDVKIVNSGSGKIGGIVLDNVNKDATVKLRNYVSNGIEKITVKNSVKIDVTKDAKDKQDNSNDLAAIKEIYVEATTKEVEVKMEDGTVTTLSGTTTAATLKNSKGDVKPDLIADVRNSTEEGVVASLKKALVDSATQAESTTSAALKVSSLLVNKNNNIDEKGARIDGYKVYARIDGNDYEMMLTEDLKKFDTDGHDVLIGSNVESDEKVSIIIKKDGETKEIAVKTITITIKTS